MKQILSVPRQPFYWDSLLVTIETRSQLISNRELHALAKSKPTPLPGAVQSPADNSRADKVLAMRTQWGCWGWTQFTSSSLFSLALLLTDAVWFSRDTFIFTAAIRSWLWTACALLLGSLPPCSNSNSHPDLHSKLLRSFDLSLFVGLSFGYWSVRRWPNFALSSVLGV